MGKIKRIIGSVLLIALTINLLPSIEIRAELNEVAITPKADLVDVKIVSNTNVTVEDAKSWARSKGATQTFINLADLFWKYSKTNGNVNPAIAYVQSAKETGYGKFGGVINESYFNPCGMKNTEGGGDYEPGAHYKFKNWDEGVQAQLDHLALYAGAQGYPRANSPDPRHFPYISGNAPTVKALGGRWAPSSEYGNQVLALYYNLLDSSNSIANLANYTMIDGVEINGNRIHVAGWALNRYGVDQVNVYLDDNLLGTANYGLSREDVNSIYPGYTNGNLSGYDGTFDISNISQGTKRLKIEQVSYVGTIHSTTQTINLNRQISRMDINSPGNNDVIKDNNINISGWALSSFGISEIKVYVDNKLKGNATYGLTRTDVNSIFPGYPNGDKSGYEMKVDVSDIAVGNRTVRIDAIGRDGAIQSKERIVNIQRAVKKPSKMDVNSPYQNEVINNKTLNIRGWALNDSGIKEVKVSLDGNDMGKANYGLPRADVNSVFPGYLNGANSGFELQLDLTNLTSGTKKLVIEAIGVDGGSNKVERTINIPGPVKKPAKMDLNSPSQNDVIDNNSISIRGWALNDSGVKEVNVYVDGANVGKATYGLPRNDVDSVFPGYTNGKNCGYEMKVDVKNIPVGNRKVTVEAIGVDGVSTKVEKTIVIKRKLAKMDVNSPYQNQKVTDDSLNVTGWAVNDSGVKDVKVSVDGKFIANANYGLPRNDVNTIFPGYFNGDKSGFELKVDLSTIPSGNRTVTLEATGNDGTVTKIDRTILIQRVTDKPTLIDINTPVENEVVLNESLSIRGWALAGNGIKEVKVFIDGNFRANANYGLPRADVGAAYPSYPNANMSGYELKLDLSDLPSGDRKVEIQAVGNDGKTSSKIKMIKIPSRANKPARMDINDPSDNSVNVSGTLKVRGWALNDSGVKEVKIYLNGLLAQTTNVGLPRPDVAGVFPGYSGGDKCGYEAIVNISGLQEGNHALKVVVIGYDNTSIESTRTFKNTNKKTIVVDAGHNYGGDKGSVSSFNGVTYSETDINIAIADKLRNELIGRGYNVIMTREVGEVLYESETDSLRRRVKIANDANADLFISVHQNAFNDPSANGTEVWYSDATPGTRGVMISDGIELTLNRGLIRATDKVNASIALAQSVVDSVSTRIGTKNRGVKEADFYVVKNTTMPSILVEGGFITNLGDVSKLIHPNYQNAMVNEIANSVAKQF